MYFAFGSSSSPWNSFSMLFIHSAFILWSLFCYKIVLLLLPPGVSMSSHICWYNFCFRCFGMSYFVCIVWSYVSIFLIFLLSSGPSYLFTQVVSFVLIVLLCSFLSEHILAFFVCLRIFACCFRYLICVFSLTYHPGFEFLFLFFRGNQIFSLTNFAPAYISSFNSVMLFVEIYVINSFISSVSILTGFLSWFLFFLDSDLFKISTSLSSSGISASFFAFEYVVFRLLLLGVSIRLGCSDFSVFSVSLIVSGSSWPVSLFICLCISNISR